MTKRLRWKFWGLVTRSRRVCPANAYGIIICGSRPVREIGVDSVCRSDCAVNGACWCGNLRHDSQVLRGRGDHRPSAGTYLAGFLVVLACRACGIWSRR